MSNRTVKYDFCHAIVQMEQDNNTLLLRFDNGEVLKFEARSDDNDLPVLTNEEPTDEDLYSVGAISDTEYHKRVDREQYRKKCEDKLFEAWLSHYQYGVKEGFPRPTKYPRPVAEAFACGVRGVTHEGLVFWKDSP